MTSIEVNSELLLPVLFKFARQGLHLEVSNDIEGFLIQMPGGEENISGTTRRELIDVLRDLKRAV